MIAKDYDYNTETDSLTVTVTAYDDGGRELVETTETRALRLTPMETLRDAIEYFDPLLLGDADFDDMSEEHERSELAILLRSCFMSLEDACEMQDVASATKRKAEGAGVAA